MTTRMKWKKEDTPGEGERLNETTTLKSFKDVLDSVQNISAFLIYRGVLKVANEFSLLGDKVGKLQFKGEVHRADCNDVLRQCDS